MSAKRFAVLLAGVILAVCSSCGTNRRPTETAGQLPSIGVPEEISVPQTTQGAVQPSTRSTEASTQPASTQEVPVTQTEPPETSTPKTQIHALSQQEIDAIRARYDGTVIGFGTGFKQSWADEYNRPTLVNNLLNRFAGTDANILAYCSDAETKAVAFSFQCGTEYGHTDEVLDILAKYGVKSTFYIIHSYGEKNHSLVERMIREGHVIGSHTYSCPNGGIARLSLEEQMQDAMKMQQYMQESFGYTLSKFNFNSGYWSEQAMIMMSRMGYQIDFCSCNYSDYDPTASFDSAEILSSLEKCLHPGCIYCFHTTNVITPTILEPLIRYCQDQGYSIIQVP